MPVHHGAGFIGSALASVAAEAPDDVEIRIYNSADDDGAARRVAESYQDRLSIIWQDRFDLKPWTAKTNLGVSEARAPYIAMLHQDDLWLPGHLSSIRQAIDEFPNAVMSIGPSRFAAADGQLLGEWRLPFSPGEYPGADLIDALLVQNSIAIPSPIIARDAWQACGGLDDQLWYTADWDLYLKLAEAGAIAVRPGATTGFRLHGGSLTMTGSSDLVAFREQLETVLDRHLQSQDKLPDGVVSRAKASIQVNCALAAASSGGLGQLPKAFIALARLGPRGLAKYFADSRIVDRLRPRLRLKLAGGL